MFFCDVGHVGLCFFVTWDTSPTIKCEGVGWQMGGIVDNIVEFGLVAAHVPYQMIETLTFPYTSLSVCQFVYLVC